MRLVIISDLHLEFRHGFALHKSASVSDDVIREDYRALSLPVIEGVDALVVAGDIHTNHAMREDVLAMLRDAYKVPVIEVMGNHEFYGHDFPTQQPRHQVLEVCGVKIAAATLWTPLTHMDMICASSMNDFSKIRGCTMERWTQEHLRDLAFLRSSSAQIIVSHHVPTRPEHSPYPASDGLNAFFYTRPGEIDPAGFPTCKLWIAGHTHTADDFMWEHIRVVINPLGYPGENKDVRVKVIDF